MEVADKTRDELIDELVKSEERENKLVEELKQAQDDVTVAVDRLEQSDDRDIHENLVDALTKAKRLWDGINNWYDKHKRGCQYAMQPGGFCAECIWVKKLIDTEREMTLTKLGGTP